MDLDYSQFENLPQQDLEIMVGKLNKIIKQREYAIIDAIGKRSVEKLKEALRHDNEKKLSVTAWNILNFYDLNEKDIEFFMYIRSLPTYAKNDVHLSDLTRTQTGLKSALFNENMFDYFIKQPELHNDLKIVIQKDGLDQRVPQEIIDKIFKNKLLYPTQKLFDDVIKERLSNYLEYFTTNDLFEISEEQFKKIYITSWSDDNKSLLSLIRTSYPAYKEITLNELIKSIDFGHVYNKIQDSERYKFLIELKEEKFLEIINEHGVNKTDIKNMVAVFNKESPQQDKKFHRFITFLVENHPDVAEKMKDYQSFIKKQFKPEYEKAINYISIHLSLENKDHINEKKMKM